MATIEANDQGDLFIPAGLLGAAEPRARYVVEVVGKSVLLRRVVEGETPVWQRSPEERVKSWLEWVNAPRPPVPDIPLEAMRRENIY